MKVKELIENLKEYPPEMNVRLVTDHGQTPMSPNCVGIGYISDNSYMPDEIDIDDIDEDSITVVVIEAF